MKISYVLYTGRDTTKYMSFTKLEVLSDKVNKKWYIIWWSFEPQNFVVGNKIPITFTQFFNSTQYYPLWSRCILQSTLVVYDKWTTYPTIFPMVLRIVCTEYGTDLTGFSNRVDHYNWSLRCAPRGRTLGYRVLRVSSVWRIYYRFPSLISLRNTPPISEVVFLKILVVSFSLVVFEVSKYTRSEFPECYSEGNNKWPILTVFTVGSEFPYL